MDVQLWTGQGHMDGLKRDKPREKETLIPGALESGLSDKWTNTLEKRLPQL
jgi:hypothetical protein